MRALGIAVLCLSFSSASLACMAQPAGGGPAVTGGVAKPGGAPPPTSTDATMPTSLPPPPPAAAMLPQTYKVGTSLVMGGAALGVGAGAFVALGVLLPCKVGEHGCDPDSAKKVGDLFFNFAIGGFVLGAVCLAVGIPLMVVGANEVRAGAVSLGPKGLRLAF